MIMKAIVVKFHGQTEFPRLRASEPDGKSVTIPYPNDLQREEAYALAARTLCEKLGWKGTLAVGGLERGNEVFVFLGGKTVEV